MSHRTRFRQTPIERIFKRVVGRKMTAEEKVRFHLKPFNPSSNAATRNGAYSGRKGRREPN